MTDEIGKQVLVFQIGPHRACFELSDVVQVYDSVSYEEIDGADKSVLGVINIRGQSAPLVDIKPRWNLHSRVVELSDQIVVFTCRGITVSIIVDKVIGTQTIPDKKILNLDDIVMHGFSHRVIAVADGIMLLLNCNNMFSQEFLQPFDSPKFQR